jgi:hypothetical protein
MTLPPADHLHQEPLVLADALHQQAEKLLAAIHLAQIIQPYGLLAPTGSYYLNVMVYPDIDLYLPKLTIEQMFAIGGQLARNDKVVQVVFEQGDLSMPGGLYLKLRIVNGEWERPWKVDLWSIEPELLEQKMAVMRHFLHCLTPDLRQQIIRYKLSIMTPTRRTPMYSGYFIYKAFIDEGLKDFHQVTSYLILNGIKME